MPAHLAAAEQANQVTAERADNDAPHHAPAPPNKPPAEQAQPPPHDEPQDAAGRPLGFQPVSASAMPFKQMENINSYTDACRRLGVPESDLFDTVDLYP